MEWGAATDCPAGQTCSGTACAPIELCTGTDNVFGWAWSENVGWISANCHSGGGAKNYGLNIGGDGTLTGYAWSENVGWISFEPADVNGCNNCSGAACQAKVDTAAASGNREITGWGRAIAACKDNLWNGTNCTGGGAGNNTGDWDGCLKFKDSYIDSNGDFHGWMTSSADATTGVIGWVNLNSVNCNGTNCTADAAYKLYTSATFGPTAKMECGGSCAGGYCDTDPNSTWVMYAPTGDCPECAFTVLNASSGNVQCTAWKLEGTTYGGTYDGKQNLTFLAGVPTGTYTLKLTVSETPKASNNSDCSLGAHATTNHLIRIKREVAAGFMCSLDDPAVIPNPLWIDCESNAFKTKVVGSGRIFLSDAALLGLHSVESEDGSQIDAGSRVWTINIDGAVTTATGTDASFTPGKSNIIKLAVGDNASRTNCQIINLNRVSLPRWQEINPVGMIFDNLQASLRKVLGLYKQELER